MNNTENTAQNNTANNTINENSEKITPFGANPNNINVNNENPIRFSAGRILPQYIAPRCYKNNAELIKIRTKELSEDLKEGKIIINDFSDIPKNRKNCGICLLDYKIGDEINILNCRGKHIFHCSCILESIKYSLDCPLCKELIYYYPKIKFMSI